MRKSILFSLGLLFSLNAVAAECRFYCDPEKNTYACGGACIPDWKKCSKSTTYGCNEKRPSKATKTYTKDQIQHVDTSETK